MRRVFGRAVGVVSCVLVAACGGKGNAVEEPVLKWEPAAVPALVAHVPAVVGNPSANVQDAHAAAVAVATSLEFRLVLASMPSMAVSAAVGATEISGQTVATRAFGQSFPIAYRTRWRRGGVTAETGLTRHNGNDGATVTLYTATTKRLAERGHGARACVINTLVHEWTHAVRTGGTFAFTDDDHDRSARPLVSYTVGAAAQCVYLARHYAKAGEGTFAFDRCIAAVGVRAFEPRSCADDWGRQFVTTRTGMLW